MPNDERPEVKVNIDIDEGTASPGSASSSKGRRRTFTSEDFGRGGRQARAAVDGARERATAFADGIFPGHGNAILWGVIGFLAALLIFVLGFWRTLFIAFLVLVGVAFGQYLDGDPKIVRALMNLIRSSDSSYPRR